MYAVYYVTVMLDVNLVWLSAFEHSERQTGRLPAATLLNGKQKQK